MSKRYKQRRRHLRVCAQSQGRFTQVPKDITDTLDRLAEDVEQHQNDPKVGDAIRSGAVYACIGPEGVECFVQRTELPGWEMLRESAQKLLQPRWFCGYARLNRTLFRELGYNGLLTYVPVHGGITFKGVDSEGCIIYGFDCAHAGDTEEKWPLEEVINETVKLAKALIIAAKYEEDYLAAQGNEIRAAIVQRFHEELEEDGIHFELSDNFGAMLKLLGGEV